MRFFLKSALRALAFTILPFLLSAQPEYNLVFPPFSQIADCDAEIAYEPAIGIPVGESQVFVFTIRNDGNESLKVTTPIGMARGEAFFVTEQPDSIIDPGQTSAFSVTFTPPCPGRYRDAFTVYTNDPDEPACTFTIDHIGLGEGPILVVFDFDLGRMIYPDPTGAEFGPVASGESESHLLWLTNVGTEPVEITQWTIPAPFFGTPQEGTILAPQSKTSSILQYAPNACGVTATDMLKVSSSAIHPACYPPGSELEAIYLSGTTEPCETGDPDIGLIGNGVSRKCGATVYFFGNNVQTITIANEGTAPLVINNVSLSNENYELLSLPDSPIAPGETTSFQVSVAAGCVGLCSAKLLIESNDPDEGSCRLNLLGIYSIIYVDGGADTNPKSGYPSDTNGASPAVLYPNPAAESVFISMPPEQSDRNYSIIDLRGRLVQTGIIPAGTTVFPIMLVDLTAGVYFVRLEGAEGSPLRLLKQ